MIAKLTIALLLLTSIMYAQERKIGFDAYKAKDITKSDVWLNGKPMSLKSLKGKVVVIDFWAFDCEPCIEAMPHIVDMYEKYSKDGLIVIGVHTPRADYEKSVEGLRDAMKKMNISFPVVVDEKQKIFHDYLCDLWPSQFIIDRDGFVRYSHGGVGRYDDMETVVRSLLSQN
jgi:thiol-disulfide isomerase/thioredoxin